MSTQFLTEQAAEKLNSEGDGGFNPRVKPLESVVALATEGRFSYILPEIRGFSAACGVATFIERRGIPVAGLCVRVLYFPGRVYVNCIANLQLRMEPSSGDSEADGE